ncbi:MAG: ATP synthase subunit C [Treponema sp.]
MSKKIFALFFALMVFGAAYAVSETYEAQASDEPAMEAQAEKTSSVSGIKYLAAAAAVGIACIAGGMAVGKIGAAAMGAMSENAELSGKALPFVGLAEGICLWGFLVGLLIIVM